MAPKPEMGKYLLYQFFAKDARVKKYLPTTHRYTEAVLEQMLLQYQAVYIKPCAGSRGKGIMKVWLHRGSIYVQHTVHKAQRFSNVRAASKYIDEKRQGKAYIIQRGLRLAKVSGRPFDIRTMVQREVPGGTWLYSGSLAKVAGLGSIVTNTALSGGSVLETETALRQGLGWTQKRAQNCLSELERISLMAAKHFDGYQYYRELGFDMAVDDDGRIWMIEQNTAPSHVLFAHLKTSPKLFQRIQYRWGHFERAKRKRRHG